MLKFNDFLKVLSFLVCFLKLKLGEIDVNPKSSFCFLFNNLNIFNPHLVQFVEGFIHQRL